MTKITAPVSRQLVVTNVEASRAFFCDVLGFERQGERDVVRGPARIELAAGTPAPASLFFETDDVSALHAAITGRGGKPTSPEKVNWIKMRMFEVRDPDGHVIWFGQSFQEPDAPKDPQRQLQELLPEFPVDDVAAAIAYYQAVLGFKINYAQDDLGVMYRDDATLLLMPRTPGQSAAGSYVYVRDADALHAELVGRGANVQGKPVSHPWGLRDFRVLDLASNRLTFGQAFE